MQETALVEQGACVALEGRTFASVDELDCGLTPDGAGRCRWQVSFEVESARASQFTWLHVDVGETGQVTCDGGALAATINNRRLRGTFDPKTLRLTWAGVSCEACIVWDRHGHVPT
jgi:hypothetical protein